MLTVLVAVPIVAGLFNIYYVHRTFQQIGREKQLELDRTVLDRLYEESEDI